MRFASTRVISTILMSLLAVSLAACGGDDSSPDNQPDETITPSITPLSIARQPTQIPTLEAAEGGTITLEVWFPEPLAPIDRTDVNDVLDVQIGDFDQSEGGEVNIQFRRKLTQDVGGIISTLRAATNVAPGALPDITLIRTEDLAGAVQSGLVYPFTDALIPDSMLDEIYPPLLDLGRVNNQLFGVPYMAEALHLAYQPATSDEDGESGVINGWSFADTLIRGEAWAFPAIRAGGLSRTFYIQYLDAGGAPPRADGSMRVDEDALLTILAYYEEARADGLFPEEGLEFTQISDYVTDLAIGNIDAGVVDSTTYLDLVNEGVDLLPAPIPTSSGNALSTVNGWLWVITTPNADRQATAARFLDWMMDVDRQRDYAEAINRLPSERSALLNLDVDPDYITLLDTILLNARLPLTDGGGSVIARAMQTGLTAVLSGESTAEEATQAVIDQENGS
jgi:ABC-type glycerol-3-phosphate transport system substrate-binding protein